MNIFKLSLMENYTRIRSHVCTHTRHTHTHNIQPNLSHSVNLLHTRIEAIKQASNFN